MFKETKKHGNQEHHCNANNIIDNQDDMEA